MQQAHILIVEDELALQKLVVTVLNKEGFTNIHTASNAEEALQINEQFQLDCIILDVMLPGRSGFEIAPLLRLKTEAPILFVTARTTDLDKLTGFALGGDDYMTKPFNPLELAARVKVQLKRHLSYKQAIHHAQGGRDSVSKQQVSISETTNYRSSSLTPQSNTNRGIYDFGRFQIDEQAGELMVGGESVDCPAMVFQLLLYLCKHPNRIFSKGELYEQVWGLDAVKDDNTVMVHIHRIRERIEEKPSEPTYLVTVRGMGYKLLSRPKRKEV
ncbi:response regulator transcription factor [Paenibacillus agilis]|uniref:Response regulator transcription factor n=1 Tax=Paenibacillus agilis TaxID=3020863 RepID=A0A559J4F8_9BACL|nr:response regulator transcription factor [Paenibacillus agilis]TVX94770.1 response regulator transcription factor [Paenibacillus agilis]